MHSAEGERPVFIAGVRRIAAVMKAAPQPRSSCPCWCLFNPAPLPEKMFACEPADVLVMDCVSVPAAARTASGLLLEARRKTFICYAEYRVQHSEGCAQKKGKLSVKMLKIHS